MPSATPLPADGAAPFLDPSGTPRRAAPAAARAAGPGVPAISPGRCARWARAEGLVPGDAVALVMHEPGEIAGLRLGLALIGVRADLLDDASGGPGRLAACGARVAIVDTGLAAAYAGLVAGREIRPAVWWNGPDADFARLDHALAEYDDAPLSAAELMRLPAGTGANP